MMGVIVLIAILVAWGVGMFVGYELGRMDQTLDEMDRLLNQEADDDPDA